MNSQDQPVVAELAVLQQWFQAVVTHPDGVPEGIRSAPTPAVGNPADLESIVTRSARLDAVDRLAVYADAYRVRLIECLAEVYPLVRRVVGGPAFEDFIVDYLQEFPPRSYTLNNLGRDFSAYLSQVRPARDDGKTPDWADFVIELARFEWALFEVFDGPGVEGRSPFQFSSLGSMPPEQWNDVRLVPAPCLRLLAFEFPLNDFFSQSRSCPEDADLEVPLPVRTHVALTRREFVVRRHALSEPEHQVLAALLRGQGVGDALAEAVPDDQPGESPRLEERIQQWFTRWSREEFFIGFTLGDPARGQSPATEPP